MIAFAYLRLLRSSSSSSNRSCLTLVWLLAVVAIIPRDALAFTSTSIRNSGVVGSTSQPTSRSAVALHATTKLSPLPKGINPFVKSEAKSLDLSSDFRSKALGALKAALKDPTITKMEVEFPPLLFKGKTQYDDFDNLQELNLNRDFCVEWFTKFGFKEGSVWFVLPDLKECELAKDEWRGALYQKAAKFTTIEQVTQHYSTSGDSSSADYSKPWGATFSDGISNLFAGGQLLGDTDSLDALEGTPDLHLICQPGNGGPVEDWINVEVLHNGATEAVPTVIVNGALDKVRDGYYPALVFPKLAKTVDRFYKDFESIFYLRPLSDKGLYGWLYRVYPEPWQVVLQTVSTDSKDRTVVTNTVVSSSDKRPTFAQAMSQMVQAAAASQ